MEREAGRFIGLWIYGILSLSYLFCFVSAASGGDNENIHYYSPENILKFADYLYQEGDYLRAAGEYQRYLFYSPEDADSTLYRLGLCYRRSGDIERAISFFHRVLARDADEATAVNLKFAASYQMAYSQFLSRQYEDSIGTLEKASGGTEGADERGKLQILLAYNYLHQRRWHDAEQALAGLKDTKSHIALSLRESARVGMGLRYRNPLLAGFLSAVVPGAGKFYCKQYGDGLYSLFLAGAAGLLAWNGFREDGVHSIKGWAFASVCVVFYAGNVYGSAVAARVFNHQLETDLLMALPPPPDD